ncbi:MAG: putative toxin-antitoxin system toxin component, PIN family [Acidobacteriota bacterium]|nr:putative toxin-antitoxin system toxin component, PIN family [Acidobacteriota bacterium]
MKAPQIVIDTNVVIAAQRSKRGASSKLMSLIGTGRFGLHISVPLILEYEEILLREGMQLGLTSRDVDDLLSAICALAEHHQIHFLWRPFLQDEKDEMLLELAVASSCDYLVTYNKRDFRGAEKLGVRVVDAREFLQTIGEIA